MEHSRFIVSAHACGAHASMMESLVIYNEQLRCSHNRDWISWLDACMQRPAGDVVLVCPARLPSLLPRCWSLFTTESQDTCFLQVFCWQRVNINLNYNYSVKTEHINREATFFPVICDHENSNFSFLRKKVTKHYEKKYLRNFWTR